jgi:hypothetical protein
MTWLVVWPVLARLPDGSWSAATPYEDERKAREAADRGGGMLIRLPLAGADEGGVRP